MKRKIPTGRPAAAAAAAGFYRAHYSRPARDQRKPLPGADTHDIILYDDDDVIVTRTAYCCAPGE